MTKKALKCRNEDPVKSRRFWLPRTRARYRTARRLVPPLIVINVVSFGGVSGMEGFFIIIIIIPAIIKPSLKAVESKVRKCIYDTSNLSYWMRRRANGLSRGTLLVFLARCSHCATLAVRSFQRHPSITETINAETQVLMLRYSCWTERL